MVKVTSAEAQNNFGKLLDMARREPVVITRHGRVAAFLLSPEDMEELKDPDLKRRRAMERFDEIFARSERDLTDAAKDLTDEDVVRMVHEERDAIEAAREAESTSS